MDYQPPPDGGLPASAEQPNADTIDDLLNKLDAIEKQEAELKKAKEDAVALLKKKLEQLNLRLQKVGVSVDRETADDARHKNPTVCNSSKLTEMELKQLQDLQELYRQRLSPGTELRRILALRPRPASPLRQNPGPKRQTRGG
jgi:hypothetical protein